MPITCEFEYHKPKTILEVLEILAKHGRNASVLAGGTDLLVWLKDGVHAPAAVVDVKAIPELHRLEAADGELFVGACVTFSQLIESPIVCEKLPLLWECSRTVASVGVRNRATLVGNICAAVPSMDGAPALLCHDAVVLCSTTFQAVGANRQDGGATADAAPASREVPVGEWFLGPKKTALHSGELVTGLRIPIPRGDHGACYVKLGRYRGEDLAQVGIGILALAGDEYRVAFCAVGPVPTRAAKIESYMSGKRLTDEVLREAGELVLEEIRPITDLRASKEYRTHMARVMLARGLRAAVARREAGGARAMAAIAGAPAYGESVI